MGKNKFQESLALLLSRKSLTKQLAEQMMGLLLDGEATEAQAGAFLAALRVKGETVPEIVGFARAMRKRAERAVIARKPLLDTCGTGGDGSGTFNISTTVAFIAAGAGAAVAKHGNRAVSSRSGSADVLEALGVRTDISIMHAAQCVEKIGVGFLFAPSFHPGVGRIGPVRKQLGTRTVFNLLGPLANPAGATRQLLGVYSTDLVEPVALALRDLGCESALIVSSEDGLDEISLSKPTLVARLSKGRIKLEKFTPETVGFKRRPGQLLKGGDSPDNAQILRNILSGQKGAPRDVCVLNAAAALQAASIAKNWKEGVLLAEESINSGRAMAALEALIRMSNES